MSRSLSAVAVCLALALGGRAADPPPATTHADLDKLAVEVLKDLHNRGADLYNAADAPGAMRLYEATLRAVGPFLAHRPKLQATIADGLVDAGKLDGAKAQAYRLHEVIDQVRNDLKAATAADAEPKPGEKKGDPKPGDTKGDPKPEPKPEPPPVGSLGGVLALDGQPLGKADVTLVSLTLPTPRVFTATADAGGKFVFPAELPPATYAVMVTGGAKPPPARYRSTMTSGVELVVKAGPNTADVNLHSK
jgi:hypothetical protein